ncbi:hypothetical protein LTR95_009987 [Oleoguttula sp. CCFEE 5521]
MDLLSIAAVTPWADFGRTFNVIVGSRTERKTFTLHEDIFFPRSNFFKAARSGGWTTDESKPVDLTDTKIATFNAYLQCVYLSIVPYAAESLSEYDHDARIISDTTSVRPPPSL